MSNHKFSNLINNILLNNNIHPILIDIGASYETPKVWKEIEKQSIYIGFDPDLRELKELTESKFYKATMVNAALTAEKGQDHIDFYLTHSPYCSSTLFPDLDSLSNYIFFNLFEVEKKEKVKALTINDTLNKLSFDHIDWFKTDTQGTDLRLFKSIRQDIRSRVLALDIEPGLIDAYLGEDLFVDAHKYLVENGFWLSDLNVCGSVRIKDSTIEKLAAIDECLGKELIQARARTSPGWCEARYLRTIEWLANGEFKENDYILLWALSLLDNQYGFALDVAFEFEKIYGRTETSKIMIDASVANLHDRTSELKIYAYKKAKSVLPNQVIKLIGSAINRFG
jgi:FkbM family methyltransferase